MDEINKIQSFGSIEPNRGIESLCQKCYYFDANFNTCVIPDYCVDRATCYYGGNVFSVVSCSSYEDGCPVVLDGDLPF